MSNFSVKFTACDNSAIIYVNGIEVYHTSELSIPPPLNDDIVIDAKHFAPGLNTIRVDGVNYGPWETANPFTFKYSIKSGSTTLATISQKSNSRDLNRGGSSVVASSSIEVFVS